MVNQDFDECRIQLQVQTSSIKRENARRSLSHQGIDICVRSRILLTWMDHGTGLRSTNVGVRGVRGRRGDLVHVYA